MIAVTQRSAEYIESSLSRSWHCVTDPSALIGATIAEHLRAMIYGASVPQRVANAARTVHTTRLMASVRRIVELTWPRHARRAGMPEGQATTPDICSVILQNLGTLGDAVDTGQGQWIAAPLRIVAPADCPVCLVVGAAPISVVRQIAGVDVLCVGAARFIGGAVLRTPESRDITQSVDAWLGEAQPLAEWTEQILSAHEARMDVLQGLSAEQLEVYAPDVLRSQRRSGRWIAVVQIGRPLDGIRLCQPQDRFARSYDKPHYLAHFEFRNGALSLGRCAEIKRELTLRLRFGLDALLNTPRELPIVNAGETFRINRPLKLPEPEERIYALGWKDLSNAEPDEKLVFHRDALPIITHALQRLLITPSITPRSSS
jgi:hypothetical protein